MTTLTPDGRRIKRGWMNLRITRVVEETWDTKTFFLEDADDGGRAFDYEAGQYLTFRYDDIGDKPLVRSYTMSSSPCQPQDVAVTVKRVTGGVVSNWMCETLKPGSIMRARGPIGKFCYEPKTDHPHLVMVAAGSGVTPFVSIMREYANRTGSQPRMTLLVSFRSQKDLICWQDLQWLRDRGMQVTVTLTRETANIPGFTAGRINEHMLKEFFASLAKPATIMTCGPEEMMAEVQKTALLCGFASTDVKTESFAS